MSQPSQPPPPPTDDLQFATAETADGNAPVAADRKCVICGQPIASTYYALGDQMMCPACRAQVTAPPQGSGFGRFMKAALLGLGAGLLGAAIWYAVLRIANIEAGLIAILVGFMVGKAVHYGSGGQGGLAYQVLAVALTCGCIVISYILVFYDLVRDPESNQWVFDAFKWAVQYPFDGSLIGLLIIGFALWEAWKFAGHHPLPISGPYEVGAAPPAVT